MVRRPSIADVFRTGGFSLHYRVGRLLKLGFLGQCLLTTAATVFILLLGSGFDGGLVLTGRNVGMLQHPGIWAFFCLQVALPLSIRRSMTRLLRAHSKLRALGALDRDWPDATIGPLLRFLNLRDPESKFVATVLYCVGLAAFVWNTYQNQRPGIVVPYDFWDSKTYVFGFWLTRLYKLYLFGWLLPYIALVHIAVLVVVLRLIRKARIAGQLKLMLFHPDGVGGFGFVPGLVTTPITVAMLISSLPTAAAFEVHRAADVTPLIGLAIVLLSAGIGYIVPVLALRSDLVALKRSMLSQVGEQQQAYYTSIIEHGNVDFESIRAGNEGIKYFESVSSAIRSLSNYPHLRRLVGYMGLAITPSVISLVLKLGEGLIPVIHPALKRP